MILNWHFFQTKSKQRNKNTINISKCFSLSLYTNIIDSLSKYVNVQWIWENPRRSSAFRGAPWRYGTTRSLCGELSLWSGAHGREMTWFQPHILETPTHQLFNWGWQPLGDHVYIFLGHFCCCSCFRSVGVTHSAIHQHGIFATGFLIFGWHNSCMILSTGSEPCMGGWKTLAERRGLWKFGCCVWRVSCGGDNKCCTIQISHGDQENILNNSCYYLPTLDFAQGCTWEKKHQKHKKNWKNTFIPLNVLRKSGHMKFPSSSQPFLFGIKKKNTNTPNRIYRWQGSQRNHLVFCCWLRPEPWPSWLRYIVLKAPWPQGKSWRHESSCE